MNKKRWAILIVLALVNLLLFVAIIRSLMDGNGAGSETANGGEVQSAEEPSETDISAMSFSIDVEGQELEDDEDAGSEEVVDGSTVDESEVGSEYESAQEHTHESTPTPTPTATPSPETTPVMVFYVIISRDENGDILDRQTKVGEIGETVSAEAESRDGFTVDNSEQSIVLSRYEAENVITFYYKKIRVVSYTIRCVDEDGSLLGKEEYSGEVGSTIYLTAPEQEGYIPLQDVKNITLSRDEEDNTVIFKYKEEIQEVDPEDEYILPYSDSRYYSREELEALDDDMLQMAINEIYARHGRKFDTKSIREYFESKSWYKGKIKPADFDGKESQYFNKYEEANRKLMVDIRDDRNKKKKQEDDKKKNQKKKR